MSGRYKVTVCNGCGDIVGIEPAERDHMVHAARSKHPGCPGPWIALEASALEGERSS